MPTNLFMQPASHIKHENLPISLINFIEKIVKFAVCSAPFLCIIVLFFVSRQLLDIVSACVIVAMAISAFAQKVWGILSKFANNSRTFETGEQSIFEFPYARDANLIRFAWQQSPYNVEAHQTTLDTMNKTGLNEGLKNSNHRDDIMLVVKERMCFQLRDGYCGIATINTALQSLTSVSFSQFLSLKKYNFSIPTSIAMAIPFSRLPYPYSINTLAELILNAVPPNLKRLEDNFIRVEMYRMEETTTFEQFRENVMEANEQNCRILVNFHRKPLFYPELTSKSSPWGALKTFMGGHWSPVASVVPTYQGYAEESTKKLNGINRDKIAMNGCKQYMALMLDVNPKYGPYMVPLERLYRAVKTKESSGCYRGMVKLYFGSPLENKNS